jgi:Zn-dependent oligopeptidase
MQYLTQILYIKYDLNVHGKKNVNEEYLRSTWFSIEKELLPFKISEDTYPMCRFDHIISYASGYYGYLWSLIYSYDAFSLFETGGVFNKELGMRFRREILEKGGTIKGTKMLENFLKRDSNNFYFFKII